MQTEKVTAVVLAGGKSSRMGQNKLLLPLNESTVLGSLVAATAGMFAEMVVVTDRPERYSFLPARVVADAVSCREKNALVGIYTGLLAAAHPYSFVTGGDMPFFRPALASYLCSICDGYDIVVPRQGAHLQPLCAVYHKSCLPVIKELLAAEKYRVKEFYSLVKVRFVDVAKLKEFDPELVSFFNINTPAQYQEALKIAARLQGGE